MLLASSACELDLTAQGSFFFCSAFAIPGHTARNTARYKNRGTDWWSFWESAGLEPGLPKENQVRTEWQQAKSRSVVVLVTAGALAPLGKKSRARLNITDN